MFFICLIIYFNLKYDSKVKFRLHISFLIIYILYNTDKKNLIPGSPLLNSGRGDRRASAEPHRGVPITCCTRASVPRAFGPPRTRVPRTSVRVTC